MPRQNQQESNPTGRSAYQPMSDNDARCGGCQGTGWATHELHHHDKTGENIWHKMEDRAGNQCVKPCSCPRGAKYGGAYQKAQDDRRAGKCR